MAQQIGVLMFSLPWLKFSVKCCFYTLKIRHSAAGDASGADMSEDKDGEALRGRLGSPPDPAILTHFK